MFSAFLLINKLLMNLLLFWVRGSQSNAENISVIHSKYSKTSEIFMSVFRQGGCYVLVLVSGVVDHLLPGNEATCFAAGSYPAAAAGYELTFSTKQIFTSSLNLKWPGCSVIGSYLLIHIPIFICAAASQPESQSSYWSLSLDCGRTLTLNRGVNLSVNVMHCVCVMDRPLVPGVPCLSQMHAGKRLQPPWSCMRISWEKNIQIGEVILLI